MEFNNKKYTEKSLTLKDICEIKNIITQLREQNDIFWHHNNQKPDYEEKTFDTRFFPSGLTNDKKWEDILISKYSDYSEAIKNNNIANYDNKYETLKGITNYNSIIMYDDQDDNIDQYLNILGAIKNHDYDLYIELIINLIISYKYCHYVFTNNKLIDIIANTDHVLIKHSLWYSMYILNRESMYNPNTLIKNRYVFKNDDILKCSKWLENFSNINLNTHPFYLRRHMDNVYRRLDKSRFITSTKIFKERFDLVTHGVFKNLENIPNIGACGSTVMACSLHSDTIPNFKSYYEELYECNGGDIDIVVYATTYREFVDIADQIILTIKNNGRNVHVNELSIQSGIKFELIIEGLVKSVEIFKSHTPIMTLVSGFHTNQVEMYYDFKDVYRTINTLIPLTLGVGYKFKFMSAKKSPMEVILKEIARGRSITLNFNEIDVLFDYMKKFPKWEDSAILTKFDMVNAFHPSYGYFNQMNNNIGLYYNSETKKPYEFKKIPIHEVPDYKYKYKLLERFIYDDGEPYVAKPIMRL